MSQPSGDPNLGKNRVIQQLVLNLMNKSIFKNRLLALFASPTRKKIASGAFWAGVGSVTSKGSVLVTSFFLARFLGQSGFGEYGMVNSTAAMLGSLAGFGVGTTATKYVAQYRESDKVRAGRIISLSNIITWISGLIYGVTIYICASWLAEKTMSAPHLTGVLKISAIGVTMGVINSTQIQTLTGFEAYRKIAFISIVGCIGQSILILFGAYLYGMTGAIVGIVLTSFISAGLSHVFLVKEMKKSRIQNWWREAWSEWRILIGFSLPAFFTILIAGPVFWGCNALLANQVNGFEKLGIFNAANQWYLACQFVPSLFMTALLPILSEKHNKEDACQNLRITKKVIKINALLVLPVAIIISAVSPWIMLGYGEAYSAEYKVLIVCVITAAIHVIITPFWFYMMASGRMWLCFWMNAGFSVFFLGACYLLLERGALGLASARLVAYIAHSGWLSAVALSTSSSKS